LQGSGSRSSEVSSASDWVGRFAHLVPGGGAVLDLAAGAGRHARLFRALGHPVLALDRDLSQLAALAQEDAGLTLIAADLEADAWPLEDRRFAGVVVVNYLHRPILPQILDAVAAGGALIYETFAVGNERYRPPRNPDFLLEPGELLEAVRGELRVVGYEDRIVEEPDPKAVQRIAAVR
jgi:SAM-dependent methyltransferase